VLRMVYQVIKEEHIIQLLRLLSMKDKKDRKVIEI
jgi:hypothetical protein